MIQASHTIKKACLFGLFLSALLVDPACPQFIDSFDGVRLLKDPSVYQGWAFFSGDGNAAISFTQENGQGLVD